MEWSVCLSPDGDYVTSSVCDAIDTRKPESGIVSTYMGENSS